MNQKTSKTRTFNNDLNSRIEGDFEIGALKSEVIPIAVGEVVQNGGAVSVQEIPHQLSLVMFDVFREVGVKHFSISCQPFGFA